MHLQNRLVALIYKFCLVAICLAAILSNTGLPAGSNLEYFLTASQYYGVLGAVVALVYYLPEALVNLRAFLKEGRYGRAPSASRFKCAVVMLMLFELLVYSFFLASTSFTNAPGKGAAANVLLHYILPVLVLLDYALFDRKGSLKAADPVYWLTLPLLYFSYVVVGAQFGLLFFGGGSYPYFFINPDQSDWGRVLLNLLYFTITYLVLSYILFFVDRVLYLVWKRRNERLQMLAISAFSTPARLPRSALKQKVEQRAAQQAELSAQNDAEAGPEPDAAAPALEAEDDGATRQVEEEPGTPVEEALLLEDAQAGEAEAAPAEAPEEDTPAETPEEEAPPQSEAEAPLFDSEARAVAN